MQAEVNNNGIIRLPGNGTVEQKNDACLKLPLPAQAPIVAPLAIEYLGFRTSNLENFQNPALELCFQAKRSTLPVVMKKLAPGTARQSDGTLPASVSCIEKTADFVACVVHVEGEQITRKYQGVNLLEERDKNRIFLQRLKVFPEKSIFQPYSVFTDPSMITSFEDVHLQNLDN
jgi:hypothetical protein